MDIQTRRNINRGEYVQFNFNGDLTKYKFWDTSSVFLHIDTFWVFADCFDKYPGAWTCFGPSRFTPQELPMLLERLKEKYLLLAAINDFDSFVSTITCNNIGKNFMRRFSKQKRPGWRTTKKRLLVVNQELIAVVEKCIVEERVLWVLGI